MARHCSFPLPELLSDVLSEVYEESPTTIRNCMQVSRTWHAEARRYAFRILNVYCDYEIETDPTKLAAFQAKFHRLFSLFQEDPRIPSYVRSLRLHTWSARWMVQESDLLPQLAASLNRLEHLQLRMGRSNWWAHASPAVQSSIAMLCGTVKSLTLKEEGDLPASLWAYQPRLVKLELDEVHTRSLGNGSSPDEASECEEMDIPVTSLRCLKTSGEDLPILLERYPNIAQSTETATLWFYTRPNARQIETMGKFFLDTQTTLSNLHLVMGVQFNTEHTVQQHLPNWPLIPSNTPSLRTLRTEFIFGDKEGPLEIITDSAIRILAAAGLHRLEEVHISLSFPTPDRHKKLQHLEGPLAELDALLAVPSLRRVSLSISNYVLGRPLKTLRPTAGMTWKQALPKVASLCEMRPQFWFDFIVKTEEAIPFLGI